MADANAVLDIAVRVKNAQEVKNTLKGIQREVSKESQIRKQEGEKEVVFLLRQARTKARIRKAERLKEMREAVAAKREESLINAAALRRQAAALKEEGDRKLNELLRLVSSRTNAERSGDDQITKTRLSNIKKVELAKVTSEDFVSRRVVDAQTRAKITSPTATDRSGAQPFRLSQKQATASIRGAMLGISLGVAGAVIRKGYQEGAQPNQEDASYFESMRRLREVDRTKGAALDSEIDRIIGAGKTQQTQQQLAAASSDIVSRYGPGAFDMLLGSLESIAQAADISGVSVGSLMEKLIVIGQSADLTGKEMEGLDEVLLSTSLSAGKSASLDVLKSLSGDDNALINLKRRKFKGQESDQFLFDADRVVATLLGSGATPEAATEYFKKITTRIRGSKVDTTGGLLATITRMAEGGKLPKGVRREDFIKLLLSGDIYETEPTVSARFDERANADSLFGQGIQRTKVKKAGTSASQRDAGILLKINKLIGEFAAERDLEIDLAKDVGLGAVLLGGAGILGPLLARLGLFQGFPSLAGIVTKVRGVASGIRLPAALAGIKTAGMGAGGTLASVFGVLLASGALFKGHDTPLGIPARRQLELGGFGPLSEDALSEKSISEKLYIMRDTYPDSWASTMAKRANDLESALRENTAALIRTSRNPPL